MCLPLPDVDQFYAVWKPLLFFANEQYRLVSTWGNATVDTNLDVEDVIKVRERIWQDNDLLDQFIQQNPAHLTKNDLDLVKNWKYRRQGNFLIYKSLKKHAIFIAEDKTRDVFEVMGLYSSFSDMFPYFPYLVKTVLIPFRDQVITDGLFQSYNLSFGSGITQEYKAIYDDAKERGEIITSLLPSSEPISPQEWIKKAEATNKKVLADFEKYLLRSGSSLKIIERDLKTISHLAIDNLNHAPQPLSLRDFSINELSNYLDNVPMDMRRHSVIGFKRFVQFAQDTGRIEWGEAEDMLLVLKDR